MYVTHHLMVIDPCAKYGKPMPKEKKKLRADHEDMSKTLKIFFKFYLEVKGQQHIGIINVCNT